MSVGLPVARGDSPFDSLGEYDTTAKAPDPLEAAKWLVHHLAGLDLYLAVVPFAVAPIVLAAWFARARARIRDARRPARHLRRP